MIHIKNLQHCYGREVTLKAIDLHIPRNTTCAVIGPSGCGKTTLLYILAGLITPGSGEIHIDGGEVKGIRQATGLILQDLGLLPWKTVWDNAAMGLKARKLDKNTICEKVSAILDELGIAEHKHKFPNQLSGGQKQRVAIARTLVTDPDILLLDEASSGLDAITKENIQNLILKIIKKRSITMVMVTHSIEEAVFLGQRILVMGQAGISSIIENSYFGDEAVRLKPEYYKICLEVRKQLYGMTE
ncbi:MAG: ABC transporter ATP-binding protein [Ruminiclostridium sp.]|nr:ABC transporter ATP-binding protein [Ruminiclostridium sp.]